MHRPRAIFGIGVAAMLVALGSCKIEKLKSNTAAIPSITLTQYKGVPAFTPDGRLSEPLWEGATPTLPFVHPGSGAQLTGSFQGRARLTWDASALYVAFIVEDHAPSSPFSPQMEDPHIWSKASGVEIMVQPGNFKDNRHYFEIQADVNGALWDTHFEDYNRPLRGRGKGRIYGHQRWKSSATIGVRKGQHGYTLEIALPWRSFTFGAIPGRPVAVPPAKGDTWRINLYAFRDGQRTSAAWSPLRGAGNFHRTSRFARVTFQ